MSLIDRFDAEYGAYHDISDRRRRGTARLLLQFEASLGGRSIEEAGAQDVRDFLLARVNAGMKPGTVRKELGMLRPFFSWLWQQKVIDAERLMEIRTVEPPRGANGRGTPNPYSRHEIQQFWREFDAAYPMPADHEKYLKRWREGRSRWRRVKPYAQRVQAKAIASLALFAGLRLHEVYDLELRDLDPEQDAFIWVRHSARKNNDAEERPRPVPWNEPLRAAVGAWLALRAEIAPDHERPWLSLWSEDGHAKPMRFRAFEMLLRDIGRGWEFRRMRHTYGTEQLRAGMPLEKLQRAMGHARIQQTLEYAKVVPDDVVKSAQRAESDFTRNLLPPEEGQ